MTVPWPLAYVRAATFLACVVPATAAAQSRARITSAEFPAIAARCPWFEDRINLGNPSVRKRALVELGFFVHTADDEYVRFLRRMLRDEQPVVCGKALNQLYDLWVAVPVDQLPVRFVGMLETQVIDREAKDTVAKLRESCRTGDADAGHAAYLLGLLQAKEALPELRALAGDANIYARYAAARALQSCGDPASARAILVGIIDDQLARYRANAEQPTADRGGREPFYAVRACQAFIKLGPAEYEAGLDKLATLFAHMEKSPEINDQEHLHELRLIFSGLAGRYLETAAAVRSWREASGKR